MKRFCLALCLLATVFGLRAQDAALVERVNKLDGYVQDLLEAQAKQQKRLDALAQELRTQREEQARPNASYASLEDLRRLADKVQEIDKKREADRDLILKELEKLAKAVKATPVTPPRPVAPVVPPGAPPDKGFEYVVQSGDTLSVIVQAYREQNIKVTVDQILKANPGLNANRLKVGQKIFIPAPQ